MTLLVTKIEETFSAEQERLTAMRVWLRCKNMRNLLADIDLMHLTQVSAYRVHETFYLRLTLPTFKDFSDAIIIRHKPYLCDEDVTERSYEWHGPVSKKDQSYPRFVLTLAVILPILR